MGYGVRELEKSWELLGTDPRVLALEARIRKGVREFRGGMKRKSAVGELTYRRWKLLAGQWYDDLPSKAPFLGLGPVTKRNANRAVSYKTTGTVANDGQPGKISRYVTLTVVEGCQTFGCQVTGSKDFGHPYHLVNPSILPFAFSLTLFCTIQSVLGLFAHEEFFNMISAVCHSYFIALTVAVILT